MSTELSVAPAEQLYRPQNWFRQDSKTGVIHLVDPLYGEDMDPLRPPRMVTEEPQLAAGLAYLEANADRLKIDSLYVRHESGADLGADGPFEVLVGRYAFLGSETFGNTKRQTAENLATTEQLVKDLENNGLYDLASFMGRIVSPQSILGYHARVNRAAILGQTAYMPIDARGDGTDLELNLIEVFEFWDGLPMSSGTRWLAGAALYNVREWVQLATLGLQLKQHFGPRVLSKVEGLTVHGAAHLDVHCKKRILGLKGDEERWNFSAIRPEELPSINQLPNIIATCMATRDDMRVA